MIPKKNIIKTSGYAQSNGITMAYESLGPADGEAIILIAGTGMQLIDWPSELVEGLADAGYLTIRYDNRDCGLSTKFADAEMSKPDAGKAINGTPAPLPYTLSDMAKDSVCLLDALGISKAHFLGASMGGAIAQLIAIDFPDRVLSLVLLGSDSGNTNIPVIAKPEAFAHIAPPNPDDMEDFLRNQIETDYVLDSPGYPLDKAEIKARRNRSVQRNYDPAALQRQQAVVFFDRFISTYRYDNLPKIQAPTLIIHGMDDVLVPVESAKDLAERIPQSKLSLIPGMNHNIPSALAAEFIKLISENAKRQS